MRQGLAQDCPFVVCTATRTRECRTVRSDNLYGCHKTRGSNNAPHSLLLFTSLNPSHSIGTSYCILLSHCHPLHAQVRKYMLHMYMNPDRMPKNTRRSRSSLLLVLVLSSTTLTSLTSCLGFVVAPSYRNAYTHAHARRGAGGRQLSAAASADVDVDIAPQVWSTGYSAKNDLLEALQEATELAMKGLPPTQSDDASISLGVVSISSLYDGQSSPSVVVPTVLSSASTYGTGIQHLVGCTTGGIVSSKPNKHYGNGAPAACTGIESEGIPGVSIILGILPDVHLKVSSYVYHLALSV